MKGVILDKGFKYYTDMRAILTPIEKDIIQYNWLISSCDCNKYPDSRIGNEYDWLSGEELFAIVKTHDIQFIWAVFSAIPKNVDLSQVISYGFPYADGYRGFWTNPISIQHTLAEIEIVPFDSSFVLLISKHDELVDRFAKYFPLSMDLENYNARD